MKTGKMWDSFFLLEERKGGYNSNDDLGTGHFPGN